MNFHNSEEFKLLVKAIIAIEDEQECIDFLEDIMTRKEMMDISQRLLVAKMLSEQAVYNKIVEETGASSATVSRVKRAMATDRDYFEKLLGKLNEQL